MSKPISQLDGNQTLQHGFDDLQQAHRVTQLNSLVPEEYDYIELTYIGAGPGTGEIGTVVYKTGGVSGTTVATLTLGYDGSNRLTSVLRN
jgi:hypothetical protein